MPEWVGALPGDVIYAASFVLLAVTSADGMGRQLETMMFQFLIAKSSVVYWSKSRNFFLPKNTKITKHKV